VKILRLKCDHNIHSLVGGLGGLGGGLRKNDSNNIKYPFTINGSRDKRSTWRITNMNVQHNHEGTENLSGHPMAQQMDEATQNM
jgi:hypothetical protein